ncbi:S8 family serine peptidase [Deinococcus sp. HMF7620]|uniref:S8 family serine peptidase n=1 Tax=Deinococcus arboris TaxID=2682977 RepID=A0A7C9M5M3_9DEIO|nr:S8 family serine peptidase [Deinococcus arboris]MVN85203.1 S8 family serine peptidase [Deinococcus arboris]
MSLPRRALLYAALPLSLSLVLTACPAPVTPTPPPAAVCPQSTGTTLMTQAVQSPVTAARVTPDWTAPRVVGRVLVTGAAMQAQGLSALAGVQTLALADGLTLAVTPAGQSDEAFAARLSAAGLTAQPDFLYQALANPNDPGVPGNGGVAVTGAGTQTQTYLNRIQAPAAWTFLQGCGKTPAAATTAILDSRVENHADLAGRITARASFLTPDAGGSDSTTGHGTAASGLVGAATNNRLGLAGVTWTGPLLAYEVLGSQGGSTSSLTQALNEAVRQGAKVVNMSLGRILGPNEAATSSDQALGTALTNAAKSAVLVAAAGNTAGDGVYFPASHPDVIAVGALGASDTALACYSARPSTARPRPVDISAPGGAGPCTGATNATQMLILGTGNTYTLQAGTSFSAPLVSGAAALMRAANPALSAAETKARLLGSANQTTAGLPILDVNAAVRAATR